MIQVVNRDARVTDAGIARLLEIYRFAVDCLLFVLFA